MSLLFFTKIYINYDRKRYGVLFYDTVIVGKQGSKAPKMLGNDSMKGKV